MHYFPNVLTVFKKDIDAGAFLGYNENKKSHWLVS